MDMTRTQWFDCKKPVHDGWYEVKHVSNGREFILMHEYSWGIFYPARDKRGEPYQYLPHLGDTFRGLANKPDA